MKMSNWTLAMEYCWKRLICYPGDMMDAHVKFYSAVMAKVRCA